MTDVRTVHIIDYGLGNLRSVSGAIQRVGHRPIITSDPAEIRRAERLIIPGVGAFGDGMAKLRERGLVDELHDKVLREKVPILGICLGAQLFAQEGHEFGRHEGLGWIKGTVHRLEPTDASLRVPHVGWNDITVTRPDPLLEGVSSGATVYFVHSYHLALEDLGDQIATAEYGGPVTAAVRHGNIVGTQFHPEKSQRDGLRILQNFVERS